MEKLRLLNQARAALGFVHWNNVYPVDKAGAK